MVGDAARVRLNAGGKKHYGDRFVEGEIFTAVSETAETVTVVEGAGAKEIKKKYLDLVSAGSGWGDAGPELAVAPAALERALPPAEVDARPKRQAAVLGEQERRIAVPARLHPRNDDTAMGRVVGLHGRSVERQTVLIDALKGRGQLEAAKAMMVELYARMKRDPEVSVGAAALLHD